MKNQDFSKEDYVLLAKLAQQTQRYDEMVIFVDKLLLNETELTAAQRNLCSSAYKNAVSNRRAQIKVLEAIKQKTKVSDSMFNELRKYGEEIKKQMNKYCLNIIKIIEEQIFPSKHQIKTFEEKVFYLKMKADYYRYLCEFPEQVKDSEHYLEVAYQTYKNADIIARSNLPQTNPIRLALHLNMSVFLYEHKQQSSKALDLANRAFEEAVANIDTVNEQNYKDCTMILQLIRDNINLWSQQSY